MSSIILKEKNLYPYIYISDDNQVNFTLPLTNVITDEETGVTITADNTCQTAAAFKTALMGLIKESYGFEYEKLKYLKLPFASGSVKGIRVAFF